MASGGEDGVGGIAGGSLEITAAEMALCFHMPDHGLDGGASAQTQRQSEARDSLRDRTVMVATIDF